MGVSRNLVPLDDDFHNGASDLVVGLGSMGGSVGTDLEQAGDLMHEFGHNLGLRHGGSDHLNNKPNYLSIMNYSFTLTGLRNNGQWGMFDYSRIRLPDLDEVVLNENSGVNGSPATNSFGTIWYCGQLQNLTNTMNSPIDWNCNASIDATPVAADVNNDGVVSTLPGFIDWDALVYQGGAIGSQSATFTTKLTPN